MKCNVGGFDRIARIVGGFAILALAFVGPQTPIGFLGLIPLVTGIFGFCPLYPIMGLNTCARKV